MVPLCLFDEGHGAKVEPEDGLVRRGDANLKAAAREQSLVVLSTQWRRVPEDMMAMLEAFRAVIWRGPNEMESRLSTAPHDFDTCRFCVLMLLAQS